MKFFSFMLVAVILAAPFFPATADTTSLRCRNDLVNVGDGKASALLECGEPVVKDAFCKPVETVTTATMLSPLPRLPTTTATTTTVTTGGCTTVDDWTYNPGYGEFMTTLRLESGKLTRITYGDRVN